VAFTDGFTPPLAIAVGSVAATVALPAKITQHPFNMDILFARFAPFAHPFPSFS
jgi:hypothetical protein